MTSHNLLWDRIVIVSLVALSTIGVVVYVLSASQVHDVGFPLDDAWIHQTYARNLAEKGEWAFVPGQPSSASTSPLYTILLSWGYLWRLPFFAWTFFLGIVALFLAGWAGGQLGALLFPDVPHMRWWTGVIITTTWHLVWAAASGMETMLFAALVLVVVWLVWKYVGELDTDRGSRAFYRGCMVGLVGAALTLTRPEGIALVALAAASMLIAGRSFPNRAARRNLLLWMFGLVVAWLVVVVPLMVANWRLTGDFLPATAAAKQAEHSPISARWSLLERYGRMILPLFAGSLGLMLPGIGFAVVRLARAVRVERSNVVFVFPLVWAFVHLSAYAIRLPANYQHGRYVIPLLPVLILYGVGGTLLLVQVGRRTLAGRVLTRSLALSVMLVTVGFWWIGARQYADDVRIINTEMVATAKWVGVNLPEDELLAVHDIGAVGYFAPRPILDLAGLVSPEVVPVFRDGEALMRLMCERQVRYLMVLPDQRPVAEDDTRLGPAPIFRTHAPYAPAAGGGNMAVYEMHWTQGCAW